jgi:hypothetical protein
MCQYKAEVLVSDRETSTSHVTVARFSKDSSTYEKKIFLANKTSNFKWRTGRLPNLHSVITQEKKLIIKF